MPTPVPIIKGSGDIIVKPYEVFFDPRAGLVIRQRFTAAGGDAALLATEAAAQSAGYSTRKVVSPVLSELEIVSPEGTTGVAQVVTDSWQMVGNEVNESAFYAPPLMAVISEDKRDVIARAIKDNSTLSDAQDALLDDTGFVYPDVADAASLQFYKELQKGQDSYAVGQYVLRHTSNASAGSTYNISDVNVERLYTTSQLLTEISNGTLWLNPCPQRLRVKIGAIPSRAAQGSEANYYLWSWRKLPSTETLTINNRIEINTEYVLYLWSTLRYELAI